MLVLEQIVGYLAPSAGEGTYTQLTGALSRIYISLLTINLVNESLPPLRLGIYILL